MATASASSSLQAGHGRTVFPLVFPLANAKVLIMNTNGESGQGNSDKRKHAISNIIAKYAPQIIFLQEFKWGDIQPQTGKKKPFKNYSIPDKYKLFKNHNEASIIIDKEHVAELDLRPNDIVTEMENLRLTTGHVDDDICSRMRQQFPDLHSRIYLKRLEVKTTPTLDLIAISWHGPSLRSMGPQEKLQLFTQLMEFLSFLKTNYGVAILVGGDFNIRIQEIRNYVEFPFYPCFYKASYRRTQMGIIDFYIIYGKITLVDIHCSDLNRDTTVNGPDKVLNHDPVLATLKPLQRTMSAFLFRMKLASPRKRSSSI